MLGSLALLLIKAHAPQAGALQPYLQSLPEPAE
jgi:hypothetical protein